MFEDTTAVSTVIPYTGIKLWCTLTVLKHVLRKAMWGHGIGRHSREEIWSIAVGDISAISNFLGRCLYNIIFYWLLYSYYFCAHC